MTDQSVKLIICNAHGPRSGPTPTQRRRKAIHGIIVDNSPHIVLFQELKLKATCGCCWGRDRPWGDHSLPDYYIKEGESNFEASMIRNKDLVNVNTKIDRKLHKLLDDLHRTVPLSFAPLSRMTARMLEIKLDRKKHKFICISWHGQYKIRKKEKCKEFGYLVRFLTKIQSEYELPIICGGDFNIDKDIIAYHLKGTPFIVPDYHPRRREEGNIIDFFLITHIIRVDITCLDLKSTKAKNPYDVLDHDPVMLRIVSIEDIEWLYVTD